ncbi:hypothetical protein Taro_015307 [Colocasia esculenta]|uniref:Glycosyltransferase n=1 Tax=Colocasia esculenta TaxID=4460 RepID=A0A843USR8_COLES|nr:hypothetical protein [Colocasia esculenta]
MKLSVPNVAILPSPGIGHLNPLLEFARHIVAVHGVSATLFVISTGASPRQRELLADPTLPPALRIVELPDLDVSSALPPGARAQTRISVIVRESLPDLRAALFGLTARPAALVVDLFGTDAFDVADELRVPKYLYFTTSAWLLAQMMHLPALDRLVRGEFAELREGVVVPGCNPILPRDLVDPLLHREDEAYSWFLHHAGRFSEARGILVNTWEGLEPAALAALRREPALVGIPTPRVFPVGPLTKPADGADPRYGCLTWLDAQPPKSVLFVAFGSRGTLSVEQTTELALGLEQSGQRFLWAARRPTEGKSEALGAYLPAVGEEDDVQGDYLPQGFRERTREKGLVVSSWAPQPAVLSHPAVGAFLTHAGWNSTMEGVVACVPMIAWPLYAEQRMNATMLSQDLGVAVRVRPRGADGTYPAAAAGLVVGREEVERVVRLVMEGEEGKAMRERVGELHRDAYRSLEEGGASRRALAEVVDGWRNGMREGLKQPADARWTGSYMISSMS